MAIEIRKVESRKDLKRFVEFHYDLYQGNEYDVPTLFSDDMTTLDKKKNAAFDFCELYGKRICIRVFFCLHVLLYTKKTICQAYCTTKLFFCCAIYTKAIGAVLQGTFTESRARNRAAL